MIENNVINNEENKQRSWLPVIIMLVIFWPVGLYLLIRKLNDDKQASLSSGRKMTVVGWVIITLGVLSWSSLMEDGIVSGTFGMLFFVAIGIILVRIGNKTSTQSAKYKRYIELVINKQLRSISAIASAIPVANNIALLELQEMIDKGYFKDAYIDHINNRVVLVETDFAHVANDGISRKMIVIPCSSCGANNKVMREEVGECQYCGSLISEVHY